MEVILSPITTNRSIQYIKPTDTINIVGGDEVLVITHPGDSKMFMDNGRYYSLYWREKAVEQNDYVATLQLYEGKDKFIKNISIKPQEKKTMSDLISETKAKIHRDFHSMSGSPSKQKITHWRQILQLRGLSINEAQHFLEELIHGKEEQ